MSSQPDRGLQALELIAQGFFFEEVGKLMVPRLPSSSVRGHLRRLREKAGTRTLPHTLYRAYELGLLACPQPLGTGQLLPQDHREVLELMAYEDLIGTKIAVRLGETKWIMYHRSERICRILNARNINHAVPLALASGDLKI